MKKIIGLRTTCAKRHEVVVRPSAIVGLVAVFGSASDFCSYRLANSEMSCETRITRRTSVYGPGRSTVIVINRHIVARNRKEGWAHPPIRVSSGRTGRPRYGSVVALSGPASVVYDPKRPLPCGATAWIETDGAVHING